jgi:cytochrome c peroxidase
VNYLGYDGMETQAIAGLTVHRLAPDPAFFEHLPGYVALFDAAFPDFPQEERYGVETAGLAIAAYERTIMANESPFQRWLGGEHTAMTDAQKNGAMVFFGAASCGTCHNGPALTDGGFHALGMPDMPGIEDLDAGNSTYGLSGADLALGRGGFTGIEGDKHTFKTPQLYNLQDSKFFGHGGTFYDLKDVIRYKVTAEPAKHEAEPFLSQDFEPIELTEQQTMDLYEFLSSGLYDPNLERYAPANVISGQCFPNNDPQSSIDLGCSEPG